jgi:preprotein translocase subunit Sec61beta
VNFYKARILEFWEKKELKKFKLVGDAPVYSANKFISFILIMTNC